jgi:hypothetical protein
MSGIMGHFARSCQNKPGKFVNKKNKQPKKKRTSFFPVWG